MSRRGFDERLAGQCSVFGCELEQAPTSCFCQAHTAELMRELDRLGNPRRTRLIRRWGRLQIQVVER